MATHRHSFAATILLFIYIIMCPCTAYSQTTGGKSDDVDDILRFVPITATYALKLSGVDGSSSWKRLLVNTATSYAITIGTTYALKSSIHKQRPDHTDNKSFPSGHASMAFAGAHILHKEYGKVSPLISIAGYGVAAFTAYDRVRRDRHDWMDVLTGGAIGIASTELGYFLGDMITKERSRYSVAVTPEGVALAINL